MAGRRPGGAERGREPASPEYLVCFRPRKGSEHSPCADHMATLRKYNNHFCVIEEEADAQMG